MVEIGTHLQVLGYRLCDRCDVHIVPICESILKPEIFGSPLIPQTIVPNCVLL